MTRAHWMWSASPLLLLFPLGCILLAYVFLSTGFVDDTLITPNRSDMLSQVELASSSNPPDIEFLVNALGAPDWFVAAAAAERLERLWQSGKMEKEQADVVIRSLLATLAAGGHWWRFGWDRDEPEFEQFRSVAIEAVSSFGLKALPSLTDALSGDSPYEREAACWITLDMLDAGLVDETTLAEQNILEYIGNLAQSDSDERVKAACTSARDAVRVSSP